MKSIQDTLAFRVFAPTLLSALNMIGAHAADVEFYGVAKTQKFLQNDAGAPSQVGVTNPFRILAVVFESSSASVLSATVSTTGVPPQTLVNTPPSTEFNFQAKFTSAANLEATAPPGNYVFTIATRNDGNRTPTLHLPTSNYPPAPHISNFAAAQAISPGQDFVLTWDAFSGGTVNDFITVAIGNSTTGEVLVETPPPFAPGVLNGTVTSVRIPGALLSANQNYQAEITFYKTASVDTTSYSGVPGLVAFGAFTDFSINTGAATSHVADVAFYGVAKMQKYSQNDAGAPTQTGLTNPFRFLAVVFESSSGSVLSATVATTGATPQTLANTPPSTEFNFQAKFTSAASLEATAPPGNYVLAIATKNDGNRTPTLHLPTSSYPLAPHVSNFAAAQAITPGQDFVLTWDAFSGGTAKDFITVLIGNAATGEVLVETPQPFEPGALNGTVTSVRIPGALLSANQGYQGEITFIKAASVDTTSYPGVPGLVAFGALTDFSINAGAAANPVAFTFSVREIFNAGTFDSTGQGHGVFPLAPDSYRAFLAVRQDVQGTYPAPNEVFFTGPPGSGLSNTLADASSSSVTATSGNYFSPRPAVAIPPAGTWTVQYKNTPHTFTLADPQSVARLVAPVPVLTIAPNGTVTAAKWSYFDRLGNFIPIPGFITNVRLQLRDANGNNLYDSGNLVGSITSHALSSVVLFSNVAVVRILYTDDQGNSDVATFTRGTVAAAAQLTAIGWSDSAGFSLNSQGTPGASYLLQFSKDLSLWTDLFSTNLTGGAATLLDQQATTDPHRFYRMKSGN